jgi:hypothetical protein
VRLPLVKIPAYCLSGIIKAVVKWKNFDCRWFMAAQCWDKRFQILINMVKKTLLSILNKHGISNILWWKFKKIYNETVKTHNWMHIVLQVQTDWPILMKFCMPCVFFVASPWTNCFGLDEMWTYDIQLTIQIEVTDLGSASPWFTIKNIHINCNNSEMHANFRISGGQCKQNMKLLPGLSTVIKQLSYKVTSCQLKLLNSKWK